MPLNDRPFHLALLALAVPAMVCAQTGTQVQFGGLKQDPGLPVQVTADKLTVNQNDNSAVFMGHVIVAQGQMRLAAPKVRVDYAKGQEASGHISRLIATEGVTLTTDTAAAQGENADYHVDTGKIVMTGNVILTQAQNAMTGKQLNIDLNTGIGVMVGRVQTVFRPTDQKK